MMINNKPVKSIAQYSSFLFSILFCITGCTIAAKSVNMIPDNYAIQNKYNKSISIRVSGGKETNPLWVSEISDEDFLRAVEESIKYSGVFSRVTQNSESDYLLKINMRNMDSGLVGFSITVRLVTLWELTDLKSKEVVWKDIITSSYKATFGDSVMGFKRVKIANEGAAKQNIRLGIHELSRLNFKSNN